MEGKQRHLVETARIVLISTSIANEFLVETILTAIY